MLRKEGVAMGPTLSCVGRNFMVDLDRDFMSKLSYFLTSWRIYIDDKNIVIFFQTILSFALSRKIILMIQLHLLNKLNNFTEHMLLAERTIY